MFILIVATAGFCTLRWTGLLVVITFIARAGLLLDERAVSATLLHRAILDTAILLLVGGLTGMLAYRLREASATATMVPRFAGKVMSALDHARHDQTVRDMSLQTMVRLSEAIEARDAATAAHCRRVASYSLALAAELQLRAADRQDIERGALLHDIGKIAVPDAVLLKDGPLTEPEWLIMRRHPRAGYDLLRELPYLEHARSLVYAHHERWHGGGYPRGLKGEQIPVGARIFAVADALDAMSTDRPYRKALPLPLII